MKSLIIIITILLQISLTASRKHYVDTYHYFWLDTCQTYQTLYDSHVNKYIKPNTCSKVFKHSKTNYNTKVNKCYTEGRNLFDCLGDTNVLFDYLNII